MIEKVKTSMFFYGFYIKVIYKGSKDGKIILMTNKNALILPFLYSNK